MEQNNKTYTGTTTFSTSAAIDAAIKEMLPYFNAVSQQRIQKAILNAKKKAVEKQNDENAEKADAQARHKFRELIPASMLNQNGCDFEYEKPIQGKTPDWIDDSARLMMESYTYERGGSSEYIERVTSTVTRKCNKYKEILATNSLGFIFAAYIDILTFVVPDEWREDSKEFRSVFNDNDPLLAIIFFQETKRIEGIQYYVFFTLCRDSSFFTSFPSWPFETMSLNQ